MRILHPNLVDNYTPLYSSQKANFPATNAKHIHLSSPWRTTGVDDQYYIIDAGDGQTITAKCAAIVGRKDYTHNLTSGVTAKIQAHPTNAWGAPDLDETIAYDADIMLKFFTETTKRFWRFFIDDPGNGDGYLNIPRLYLGTYYQMPITWEKDLVERIIDTSRGEFSPSGQFYGDEGFIFNEYPLRFTHFSDAEKRALAAIFDEIVLRKPAIFLLDENNLMAMPPIYAMVMEREYPHLIGFIWQATLTIRETF